MITKRGGRYRVVVYAGTDSFTGRRLQLSGSEATEDAAKKLERRLEARADRRRGRTSRVTLDQVVEEWWASNPRLAPTTRSNYRTNLDTHVLPALGSKPVDDIGPRMVAQFIAHLAKKGLKPPTQRKVRTVLSAVMGYAVAMEWIESNPVQKVAPPELDDTDGVAPTIDETAQILLTAEAHDKGLLDYLWVAAEEGGRRGEVLGLRWGGVNADSGTITISSVVSIGDDGVKLRARTKTKRDRTIAVSPITMARLLDRKARQEGVLADMAGRPVALPDSALVFSGGGGSRRTPIDGKPWRPDSTSRRFRQIKDLAGVNPDIDLHGLRKTMITELLIAGVDPKTVMARGGQTTANVTLGLYAKVRPAGDAAAADAWGQMISEAVERLRKPEPAKV